MTFLDTILISFAIIGISLIAIFIPGFLIAILLVDRKSHYSFFWMLVPFLGIAFSILILQTLVYMSIPLSYSVFPFFFILLFILLFFSFKIRCRSLPEFPKKIYILAILVLLISGTGYFFAGADAYIGNGYIDQFNYVSSAQFLMDKPFNTNFNDIQQTPYLVTALLKKDDRLGQSILQGYIAILSGINAKTAYGAITLLSPFLLFFSSFLLCQRLFPLKNFQYGASFATALIPGFAMIHLDNFLSQSLAIPFLLLWPLIIDNILENGNLKNILIGMLFFSAIHSIYPDFTIILILLSLLGFIWHYIIKKEWKNSLKSIICLLFGGLFINVGYIQKSIEGMSRPLVPHSLENIYPFSFKIEGLKHVWFGDFGFFFDMFFIILIFNFAALLLTVSAYIGIFNNFKDKKDVVSILLVGFLMFPLFILAFGDLFPYQFYKMLLTISPILMIGVWLTITSFWVTKPEQPLYFSQNSIFSPLISKKIFSLLLCLLLIVTVISSGYTCSNSFFGGGRSITSVSNSKAMIDAYNNLESQKNQNFIISSASVHPEFPLAWASYHGRNNNIFFMDNVLGDVDLHGVFSEKFSFNDPSQFPRDVKPIVVGPHYPKIIPPELNQKFCISIDLPTEGNPGSNFNWMNHQMTISIYSLLTEKANVTLTFDAYPGPGNPDQKRILKVNNREGLYDIPVTREFDSEKNISIPLTLYPGINHINVELITPDSPSTSTNKIGRLLVHISNMTISKEM